MEGQREFEGKDLEEALQAASATLGIAEPDLDYRIVEQGRRGLFGLGAKSVRIRVMPPVDDVQSERPARRSRSRKSAPKPERAAAPAPPADLRVLQETAQKMINLAGLSLQVRAQPAGSGSGATLELSGRDQRLLMSKDAELLSALQFLLNRMGRRTWPEVGRVHVTCNSGGSKKTRDEDLVELVREVTQQVSRTGQTKRLHAMNAYERRLVHLTVRECKDVGSRSEGSGYLKKVTIYKQQTG